MPSYRKATRPSTEMPLPSNTTNNETSNNSIPIIANHEFNITDEMRRRETTGSNQESCLTNVEQQERVSRSRKANGHSLKLVNLNNNSIPIITNHDFDKIIAEIRPSSRIVIYDRIIANHWPSNNDSFRNPLNKQITQAIEQNEMIAATDASYKYKRMTGHWIISSSDGNVKLEKTIYQKTME